MKGTLLTSCIASGLLLLSGCSNQPVKSSLSNRTNSISDSGTSLADADTIPSLDAGIADARTQNEDAGLTNAIYYDDCLLERPSGTVPQDLYTLGTVTPSSDLGLFTKSINVYGIQLVAKANVSDEFLNTVGQIIVEMFPRTVSKPDEQAEILRNLYAYKAAIPVFAGGESGIDENAIRSIGGQFSICDIIMQGSEGQVMEVIEHILHHVTDIGLHKAFVGEWGMTNISTLSDANAEAIAAGVYQTSSYRDIDELNVRQRVILQEFAYWIISSYWDLQTPYGPNEQEWTASTPSLLQSKVPIAHQLMETSIKNTMAAPSRVTLDKLTQWEP